jgi:hypothetical protein
VSHGYPAGAESLKVGFSLGKVASGGCGVGG